MEIEFDPPKTMRTRSSMACRSPARLILKFSQRSMTSGSSMRFDRAYGLIDGVAYCLAYAVRGEVIRPISLRRAHAKEVKRYVPEE